MEEERRRSKRPGGWSTADLEPRTIAVSRPIGRGEDTARMVRALGWTPFIFHTVELKSLKSEQIQDQIRTAFSHPVDWIVFMSSTGVKTFFENLASNNPETITVPPGSRVLAIGPRTKESLLRYGVADALVPERYSSEGVGEWFSRETPKSSRVVLVRSASADDSLSESLRSRGATVATINVYESGMPSDTQSVFDLLSGLRANRFGAVLFTSAISVSKLFSMAWKKIDGTEVTGLLKRVPVGAIGPVTAEELRERGIKAIVPDEYLIENAVAKLVMSLDSSVLNAPSSSARRR